MLSLALDTLTPDIAPKGASNIDLKAALLGDFCSVTLEVQDSSQATLSYLGPLFSGP